MTQATGKCIHLLDYECCAICNGTIEKNNLIKQHCSNIKCNRAEHRARHLYMQESSKFFASNHNKPYTNEELKYIIINTKDTTRQDTETFFNIAREVKRRLGSIEWLWNYMWRENFEMVLKEGYDNRLYERIQKLKKQKNIGKI